MQGQVQTLLGCGAMARYLGVSETFVRMLDIPADATFNGRKAWTLATAERVRLEREARQHSKGRVTGSVAAE
jgi:hypothetical protein